MAKYIDAEKLRAEIKFAKSVYDNPKRVVLGIADAYRQDGRAAMCDDILKRIESLQQEQPGVDLAREIEAASKRYPEVSYAKLSRIAKRFYELGKNSKDILSDDPDKSLDADLEKEIDNEWKKCNPIDEGMGVETANIHIEAFDMIAHHFYELGKKDMKNQMMKESVEANVIATKCGDKYQ